VPVKLRVTRTPRGTLQAMIDEIRTDEPAPYDPDDAATARPEVTAQAKAWNPMEPLPGPDARGQ
jgi:hypothetical protein